MGGRVATNYGARRMQRSHRNHTHVKACGPARIESAPAPLARVTGPSSYPQSRQQPAAATYTLLLPPMCVAWGQQKGPRHAQQRDRLEGQRSDDQLLGTPPVPEGRPPLHHPLTAANCRRCAAPPNHGPRASHGIWEFACPDQNIRSDRVPKRRLCGRFGSSRSQWPWHPQWWPMTTGSRRVRPWAGRHGAQVRPRGGLPPPARPLPH